MRKSIRIKALGLALSLVCLAAAAAFASGATGAYFSDTKDGTIAGTGGTVRVVTSGLNLSWPSMLPGEVYSAAADYVNDGTSAQDIWVVFPNETALSALNSLGTYGAAQIIDTRSGQIFYSNNLNDHPVDQGPICKMLPKMIKLASAVPVGMGGTMTFKFQYASMLSGGNGLGFPFNKFPVIKTSNAGTGGYPSNDGALAGFDQYRVTPGQVGTGLPYQIVATQVGIVPGDAGTVAGF